MHLFLGLSWSGCFLEENQRENTGVKDVHCFVITDLNSLRLCPELNFSFEPCCISQRARVAETALALQSCKPNKSSLLPARSCTSISHLMAQLGFRRKGTIASSVLQVKACKVICITYLVKHGAC